MDRSLGIAAEERTDVRQLSDDRLHRQLLGLRSKEARITALVIAHLNEVYRRRLYVDFQCSSIYDYCIQVLKYSNGEAHRKISACKLVSQVPSVKDSISSGELSLSNAASVQSLVTQIQKSESQKALSKESVEDLVNRAKNKSTRQWEQELVHVAEEFNLEKPPLKPSRKSFGDQVQLKVTLNRDNLDKIKDFYQISCDQKLIECLLEEKISQVATEQEEKLKQTITARKHKTNTKPRSISLSKRKIVWKKANGQCENCGSQKRLEIDHQKSVAKGGGNELSNLRLLCKTCNQRAAIQQVGFKKLEPYICR